MNKQLNISHIQYMQIQSVELEIYLTDKSVLQIRQRNYIKIEINSMNKKMNVVFISQKPPQKFTPPRIRITNPNTTVFDCICISPEI